MQTEVLKSSKIASKLFNNLKNTQIKCPTENMVTSMYQGKLSVVIVDYE